MSFFNLLILLVTFVSSLIKNLPFAQIFLLFLNHALSIFVIYDVFARRLIALLLQYYCFHYWNRAHSLSNWLLFNSPLHAYSSCYVNQWSSICSQFCCPWPRGVTRTPKCHHIMLKSLHFWLTINKIILYDNWRFSSCLTDKFVKKWSFISSVLPSLTPRSTPSSFIITLNRPSGMNISNRSL